MVCGPANVYFLVLIGLIICIVFLALPDDMSDKKK